jgi:nickel transport protein
MLIILFFVTDPADAHRVNVFAWVEGDTVRVESKFAGGRKVRAGEISVFDPQGNRLLTGKTNAAGEFSFKIPKKAPLKIVLKAGMGHQGEWTVPVEELETAAAAQTAMPIAEKQKDDKATTVAGGTISPPVKPTASAAQGPITGPDSINIQAAVERALDKKLKPIIKMLAESRHQGPTINDVLGGIGYILGLVGIAAYFKYRSSKD